MDLKYCNFLEVILGEETVDVLGEEILVLLEV